MSELRFGRCSGSSTVGGEKRGSAIGKQKNVCASLLHQTRPWLGTYTGEKGRRYPPGSWVGRGSWVVGRMPSPDLLPVGDCQRRRFRVTPAHSTAADCTCPDLAMTYLLFRILRSILHITLSHVVESFFFVDALHVQTTLATARKLKHFASQLRPPVTIADPRVNKLLVLAHFSTLIRTINLHCYSFSSIVVVSSAVSWILHGSKVLVTEIAALRGPSHNTRVAHAISQKSMPCLLDARRGQLTPVAFFRHKMLVSTHAQFSVGYATHSRPRGFHKSYSVLHVCMKGGVYSLCVPSNPSTKKPYTANHYYLASVGTRTIRRCNRFFQ